MGSHSRREIDRARALRAVKAPNGLNSQWVKIHRLTAVAPAGSDGERCAYILRCEELRALCRLCASADCTGGDDTFNRRAIRIEHIRFNQRFRGLRHCHGFALQAFTHAAPTAVNDRSDSNCWLCHIQHLPFK